MTNIYGSGSSVAERLSGIQETPGFNAWPVRLFLVIFSPPSNIVSACPQAENVTERIIVPTVLIRKNVKFDENCARISNYKYSHDLVKLNSGNYP